ncbi:MAG: hypothetical protein GY859_34160 [Desulfobacterales bacterium]|nr:hypothetical protein [Desulfobacterales bacterium]
MPGPKAAVAQLREFAEQAHRASLHVKAARIFGEAKDLAAQHGLEKDRVYLLFWEAYSLVKAEETDAAMPLLLEAANARMPEVNPADAFNAAVWLLEISLTRKPVSFCRDLISQTRDYLIGINKQSWGHMLDFLEGSLEYHRGDFPRAHQCFLEAWESGPRTIRAYPSYTPATYLEKLFDTAFHTRDPAGMRKWVEAMEACGKEIEVDKIRAMGARLRMFRADRAAGGDFHLAPEMALASLDVLELVEGNYSKYIIDFLRTLMLARRWQVLERRLGAFSLEGGFRYYIFRGDTRLCQAREAMGAPIRDDEYENAPAPDAPSGPVLHESVSRGEKIKRSAFSSFFSNRLLVGGKPGVQRSLPRYPGRFNAESVMNLLERASRSYNNALEEAGKEDERLDTAYYTTMVENRLARVKALEKAAL